MGQTRRALLILGLVQFGMLSAMAGERPAAELPGRVEELVTLGKRLTAVPSALSAGAPERTLLGQLELLKGISARSLGWLLSSEANSREDLEVLNHFARHPELRAPQVALGRYRQELEVARGIFARQRELPQAALYPFPARLKEALSRKWDETRKDQTPVRWDGLKKDGGTPIYRREICGLVASDLQAAAQAAGAQALIVRVSPTTESDPKDAGALKVLSRSSPSGAQTWVSYSQGFHVATLVTNGKGGWGVVDPLTFGDTEPQSVSTWLSRLKNWRTLGFEVIRRILRRHPLRAWGLP